MVEDGAPSGAHQHSPGGLREEAAPKENRKYVDPFEEIMGPRPELLREVKMEMLDLPRQRQRAEGEKTRLGGFPGRRWRWDGRPSPRIEAALRLGSHHGGHPGQSLQDGSGSKRGRAGR